MGFFTTLKKLFILLGMCKVCRRFQNLENLPENKKKTQELKLYIPTKKYKNFVRIVEIVP